MLENKYQIHKGVSGLVEKWVSPSSGRVGSVLTNHPADSSVSISDKLYLNSSSLNITRSCQ